MNGTIETTINPVQLMWTTVYKQFGKPEGALGHLAGWIMANRASNQERNSWTVSLLGLHPEDRVLEIGFGPGLALALVAEKVSAGEIVGIDHSTIMLEQASARNAQAIGSGRMRLAAGSLGDLAGLGGPFNKVYSVNVAMFWKDRLAALAQIRQAMCPGALLATAHQPRHRGAKPEDAEAFAQAFLADLALAGFQSIRIERLALQPMPAVCILGCTAAPENLD